MNSYVRMIKFLDILSSEDRYFITSEICNIMLEQHQVKVDRRTLKSMAEAFNEVRGRQRISVIHGNPIKYKLLDAEDMKMPQLLFDKWHWVETDGLPKDECTWCLIMWQCYDGTLDIYVGSYFAERQEFYVNFGLGGTILDAEHVIGWADFRDCKWHAPEQTPKSMDAFLKKHPYHMHIALDEERILQDGLDPEEKWMELKSLLVDMEEMCMPREGFVVAADFGTRSWFNEQLENTPWFMKYVTHWEIDDPTVKDDVIEAMREMGIRVGE